MKRTGRGLALLLSAFLFVAFFCYCKYLLTGGFAAEKIHSHCPKASSFDFYAPEYLEKMLDQPFFYLGKGRQAYVFSSQDGSTVIKFLRDQKYRPSLWMRFWLFFQKLSVAQKKVLEEQKERFERAFLSYQIASHELLAETELLRTHIGGGFEQKKILLVDGFSRKFYIDLGKTSYLLQRKGESLSSFLVQAHQKNDEAALQKIIRSFFETIGQRIKKKILVRDAHCTLQNTAVCRGRVIEIDVGSFYPDAQCSFEKELWRSAEPLREFLKKNMPELLCFFDEEAKRAENGG